MVSSVKDVRAGTLLSPDVHTKENRLAEKKIRDQAIQTAGTAKKSHLFQYGGVEGSVAALETKLVTETQKHDPLTNIQLIPLSTSFNEWNCARYNTQNKRLMKAHTRDNRVVNLVTG